MGEENSRNNFDELWMWARLRFLKFDHNMLILYHTPVTVAWSNSKRAIEWAIEQWSNEVFINLETKDRSEGTDRVAHMRSAKCALVRTKFCDGLLDLCRVSSHIRPAPKVACPESTLSSLSFIQVRGANNLRFSLRNETRCVSSPEYFVVFQKFTTLCSAIFFWTPACILQGPRAEYQPLLFWPISLIGLL